eukprot:Nk52_evm43s2449 gene=Nk52_evmTU43s2449
MVPKKRASKRLLGSLKHSIQKKARAQRKKLQKEQKKNPSKGANKLKKDPGIPNLFPLKGSVLKELEVRKEREAEELRRDRQRQREFAKQSRKSESDKMKDLVRNAAKRNVEYEHRSDMIGATELSGMASVDSLNDNSKKAYYKEFKKVVEAADVILEVLDARDPLGCRCPHIEEMILSAQGNKKIILVLNKIDLVPREITEKWIKYLKNEFPTVAFKSSTQNQKSNLSQSKVSVQVASDGVLSSSECLGADMLMKLLKNYCRNADIKTAISVGVIGYPNAGKSSLINSLKRSRACGVGSTPGFTKLAQEVHIDKHVKLIDSPGIVFTSGNTDSDVLLRNCIKVEQLADPITPVNIILKRCRKEQLMEFYCIPNFNDVRSFLGHLALKRGKLAKGGIPNVNIAARTVLQDWNSGKISFYTHPPERKTVVQSKMVSGWSEEFKLAELETDMNDVLEKGSAAVDENSTAFMNISCGDGGKIRQQIVNDAEDDEDMAMSDEDVEEMEMEEEYSMDEDEEEEMSMIEEDAHVANNKKQTTIVELKKKNKREALKKKPTMDDEDLLNPQMNRNRKKAQKQQQRDVRRGVIASEADVQAGLARWGEDDDEMVQDDDEEYDFKTDFVEMDNGEDAEDGSGYESL